MQRHSSQAARRCSKTPRLIFGEEARLRVTLNHAIVRLRLGHYTENAVGSSERIVPARGDEGHFRVGAGRSHNKGREHRRDAEGHTKPDVHFSLASRDEGPTSGSRDTQSTAYIQNAEEIVPLPGHGIREPRPQGAGKA